MSFPFDWLVVENLRLINYTDMTEEGKKKKIFNEFERMAGHEIELR